MLPRLTWIPAVTCPCGERHHLGARYYVSVFKSPELGPKGPTVLAAGPYLTHPEALAVVDVVRRIVLERYDDGWAWFYAYGTVAMPHDFTRPGKLNDEVRAAIAAAAAPKDPEPERLKVRRRRRKGPQHASA